MTTPALPSPPAEELARLLPPDVDLGHPARHEAARPVWLGMVWSRLGRGDLAWQFWDRVGADEVRPWMAAERGRVLRELGLHAEAERIEWPALAAASDPVDRAMLQVSLAADAVGRGDGEGARRRFATAGRTVADLPDSPRAARQRLRLTWVGVEVAWVSGGAPRPDGLPQVEAADLPADLAAGSAFHRAKAWLFSGLVGRDLRALDRALREAPPVLVWAIHLARADLGAPDAEAAARQAWTGIRPPAPHAAAVAATATARRLRQG